MSKYEQQGYNDGYSGLKRDNPYLPGSWKHTAYNDGYEEGQAAAEEEREEKETDV